MMDFNCLVWIFGNNHYGQIGDGFNEDVNEPKEMIMFRGIVAEIKTGLSHVYVKCSGDKHYFWRRNDFGQCMVESAVTDVRTPDLLNLKEKQMEIRNVFLGSSCTILIVQP